MNKKLLSLTFATAFSATVAQAGEALDGNPEAGKQATGICSACHTFNENGPHVVGPNLFGVFGRDIASAEGFSYSGDLEKQEGEWTTDKLKEYIDNPASYGSTRMPPLGLDQETITNIVAYLETLGPEVE